MTVETALADFLTACRADGLASKTVQWYGAMLRPMVEYFIGREVGTVTTQEIREYIVSLSERESRYGLQRPTKEGGLSEESIKSHKRAILRFWKWCADEYEIADPAARIKHPGKTKGKTDAGINSEDLRLLIQAAAQGSGRIDGDVTSIRDLAAVTLLADSTVRASGLLSIAVKDVDIPKRTAIVTEKGDRLRRVHFSAITAVILNRWLEVRPKSDTTALFLALTRSGNPIGALTYHGLYQMLKRLAERAGIEGRFNPHSFRHGFAKHFLEDGGNIGILAQLMGHTSVNTTLDFYAQFGRDELSKLHDEHSPIKAMGLTPPDDESSNNK